MTAEGRAGALRTGIRLEVVTVVYNLAEGVAALVAAILSGSPALLGYGLQSGVESAAGGALLWRLDRERRRSLESSEVERLEHLTGRLVAVSLVVVALLVAFDSARRLIAGERPEPSLLGLATAAMALVVQPWLFIRKRRAARTLGSAALLAEASQTLGCIYLSAILVVALSANAILGWWWADPIGGIIVGAFLLNEAREAWADRELDDA